MIVVDASVALAWCLLDEEDEYANRLLGRVATEGAIAPAHWPLEIANALLVANRRGLVDEDGIRRASGLLARLRVTVAPVELSTAAWSILDTARQHGLTAYDAAYIDLARFKGATLATLDQQIRNVCANAGVELAT